MLLPRMMLITLERFAGPPNPKFKLLSVSKYAQSEKWSLLPCDGGNLELDKICRNKEVQPTDNRSCTSKLTKWGLPGKRTVQHKPIMTEKRTS